MVVRKRLEHTEGRRRTRSRDSATVVLAGRAMGARISAATGLHDRSQGVCVSVCVCKNVHMVLLVCGCSPTIVVMAKRIR